MLGKQPRKIDPGYAYMVPPDGKTFHSNINLSNKPVRLFYFGLFDGENKRILLLYSAIFTICYVGQQPDIMMLS